MTRQSIVISWLVITFCRDVVGNQECSASFNDADGSCSVGTGTTAATSVPFCGLYMAESTIPGAGVGIFTAEAKVAGDVVGNGDICIPVIDMYWHNGEKKFFNPFYDYFWNGYTMGMAMETDTGDIEALCPGLDCAINCNLALLNVEKSTPIYNDADLHRSVDPGVGSFSPYGNGTTYVSRPIPAGGELFKHYGDHWFEGRTHIFGLLPLSDDYPTISKLLTKMMKLKTARDATKSELFREFYEDIIVKTINTGEWESRTLNALPKNVDDAKKAGDAGDISVVHQPGATRDLQWLAQNGKCIDHIRSGRSTLRQAGHGAFAKRNLPAGTVITASPLHHIPDYTFMNMYNFTQQTGEDGNVKKSRWYRLVDEVEQQQVLYNYCFGHAESTMLLCPYGVGINYINHNQSLANVRIQWAKGLSLVHSERVVNGGTIEELSQSTKPTLAFDYIATRDIAEGEEIFLDYGDIWEEAWQTHVNNYEAKNPNDAIRYASGHQWNNKLGNLPLRTEAEQVHDPYPTNLQIRCHRSLLQKTLKPNTNFLWKTNQYGLPCRILDRFTESEITNREELLYTVQMEWAAADANDDEDEEDHGLPTSSKTVTWIERTDVPRSAIRFLDMPYTTDIHLVNSFRHEIQIPDDIMPEQWKNL
jgi:SET domain